MPTCLFINACLRGDGISRTAQLCRHFLARLDPTWTLEEVDLAVHCPAPLTAEAVDRRDALLTAGALDDPLLQPAQQLTRADLIVIGAPYWDLSFPAALKCYLEAVSVCGITFRYDENGRVISGLHAKKVVYITTAGGMLTGANFGYDYVAGLFGRLLGVPDTACIAAEGLDLVGNDAAVLLHEAMAKIDQFPL